MKKYLIIVLVLGGFPEFASSGEIVFPTVSVRTGVVSPGEALSLGQPHVEASVPATSTGRVEVLEELGHKTLRFREETPSDTPRLELRLDQPLSNWRAEITFEVEELTNDHFFHIFRAMQGEKLAFLSGISTRSEGSYVSYVFRESADDAAYTNRSSKGLEVGQEYRLIVTGDSATQKLTFSVEGVDTDQEAAYAEQVGEIDRLIIGDVSDEGSAQGPTSVLVKKIQITEEKR